MSDMYAPNQQVVREDGSGPAEEGTGGGSAAPGDDLDTLTKDELLAEAEALGIEASSSMTKAQIIEAIRAG